ncbi:MAG: hypothetical protein B7733_08905 [Myxococcales bacterium FL481]|nr:MAG: hypothetical protein B7733_08905 [Myxococcales bacterium FL481]
MLPLFVCVALAYCAALASLVAPVPRTSAWAGLSRGVLALAGVCHLAVIGSQCLAGRHPLASFELSMSVGGWLAVAGYFALSSRHRVMRPVAAAATVLALVSVTASVVSNPEAVESARESPWLLRVHISLATIGVGGFALATGVAGFYLSMQRRLRNHELPATSRGTSLMGLDQLHYWVMAVVTPIFALAVATGVVVAVQTGGDSLFSARVVASVGAFLASVAVLTSRAIWGLRGRRAAWLTVLAALGVLVVLATYGVRA